MKFFLLIPLVGWKEGCEVHPVAMEPSSLLVAPTTKEVNAYYKLFAKSGMLEVKHSKTKGKGVHALIDIPSGCTILKERPIVAAQDTQSRMEAICCRFVGIFFRKKYVELKFCGIQLLLQVCWES